MKPDSPVSKQSLLLGVEGGATRTVALLATLERRLVRRIELGSGNLRLLTDRQLAGLLRSVVVPRGVLAAVAVGLAGARTAADRGRIEQVTRRLWPGVPCHCTHDLETSLTAAEARSKTVPDAVRVLVQSGTGSCCFGRNGKGEVLRIGGWGHQLGDRGSGYALGLNALREVVAQYDFTGRWPALGERLLRVIVGNQPDDLIAWLTSASKDEVAALAPEVFQALTARDPLASRVVNGVVDSLAREAVTCARRLGGGGEPTTFWMGGGNFCRQKSFAHRVRQRLRAALPGCQVRLLRREGAWGAVELADRMVEKEESVRIGAVAAPRTRRSSAESGLAAPADPVPESPTEQSHPASVGLDRMTTSAAVELFLREDRTIPTALRRESASIGRACTVIGRAFRSGGRLFYLGAGTSGRLGVLDASECPPTFGVSPTRVQGILAGGREALVTAVEGAEDDVEAGEAAVRFRGVRAGDVVVGIAASGRTPFVWGGLRAACERGARTILVCFNPAVKQRRRGGAGIVIAPDLGPELLTGSTRLKAGTATKMILNLFTTLGMVRLGKVMGNRMVDLQASNVKLRGRAVMLVRELSAVDEVTARSALEKSEWNVRRAVRLCGGWGAGRAGR